MRVRKSHTHLRLLTQGRLHRGKNDVTSTAPPPSNGDAVLSWQNDSVGVACSRRTYLFWFLDHLTYHQGERRADRGEFRRANPLPTPPRDLVRETPELRAALGMLRR